MEEILVFKTNASEDINLENLSTVLNKKQGIKAWNFDFNDSDNIFRLLSTGVTSDEIIKMLVSCNIEAIELHYLENENGVINQ